MGCAISTSVFKSCSSVVFKDDFMDGVIVYCDDDLIYAEDESDEAHMRLVRKIVAKLEKIKAKVKLVKVQLCRRFIVFLGIQIDSTGISIANKFVNSVLQTKSPTSLTELRSFLGLVNCQRMFVSKHVELFAPLQKIVRDKPVNSSIG